MSEPGAARGALTWIAVALGCLPLATSVYTLDSREVAVVTSFGAPVKTITEPGLKLRAPWPIHVVERFDSRARLLAVAPTEVLTRDKKNLVVEAFVIWKVADPLRFLEAVEIAETAEARIADLVSSRIAAALGNQEFESLLSTRRGEAPLLPAEVLTGVGEICRARFGVEVLALRLEHLGLPLQNEQSIYERMRAERKRIANAYRSEGEEQAITIRARADRQAAELTAAAEREAATIRARSEGAVARVYAGAYVKDPVFYRYLRTLDSYEALLDEGTVLVIDSESGLFDELTGGGR
jgi:membrane protease subunit HflC